MRLLYRGSGGVRFSHHFLAAAAAERFSSPDLNPGDVSRLPSPCFQRLAASHFLVTIAVSWLEYANGQRRDWFGTLDCANAQPTSSTDVESTGEGRVLSLRRICIPHL